MALQWHRAFPGGVRWRLVQDGVEIEGEGVPRTPGHPATMRKLLRLFYFHLRAASSHYGVPVELILATIATESGSRLRDLRKEPGYISDEETPHRISVGIMHTLISTARSTLKSEMSDPKAIVTRQWLKQPGNAIRAGTAYIAKQKPKTQFDPPLVAAAYNAGSVYQNRGAQNRWKLRQFPIGSGKHVDRFIPWYNDAVAVVNEGGLSFQVDHVSYWFSHGGGLSPSECFMAAKKAEGWRVRT